MKEFWNTIQLMFTAVGGWLGWFLGGCDGLLYALIAFVVIDYITGVMCAINDQSLSSEVGFRGICKKLVMGGMIGIANLLDMALGVDFIRAGVMYAFIANETISIIENAGCMGIPIPAVLRRAIDILAEKEETK